MYNHAGVPTGTPYESFHARKVLAFRKHMEASNFDDKISYPRLRSHPVPTRPGIQIASLYTIKKHIQSLKKIECVL